MSLCAIFFLSACEPPEMVSCKYILMPPNKHNLASVEAVMGCEDHIIVEIPACVGLG